MRSKQGENDFNHNQTWWITDDAQGIKLKLDNGPNFAVDTAFLVPQRWRDPPGQWVDMSVSTTNLSYILLNERVMVFRNSTCQGAYPCNLTEKWEFGFDGEFYIHKFSVNLTSSAAGFATELHRFKLDLTGVDSIGNDCTNCTREKQRNYSNDNSTILSWIQFTEEDFQLDESNANKKATLILYVDGRNGNIGIDPELRLKTAGTTITVASTNFFQTWNVTFDAADGGVIDTLRLPAGDNDNLASPVANNRGLDGFRAAGTSGSNICWVAQQRDSTGNVTILENSSVRIKIGGSADLLTTGQVLSGLSCVADVDAGNSNWTTTIFPDRMVYNKTIRATQDLTDAIRPVTFNFNAREIGGQAGSNVTFFNHTSVFFDSKINHTNGLVNPYNYWRPPLRESSRLHGQFVYQNQTAGMIALAMLNNTFSGMDERWEREDTQIIEVGPLENTTDAAANVNWNITFVISFDNKTFWVNDSLHMRDRYLDFAEPDSLEMREGTLNTSTPGDKNADGWDESTTCYIVEASVKNRTRLNITGTSTKIRFWPCMEVRGYDPNTFPFVAQINSSGRFELTRGTDYLIDFRNNNSANDELILWYNGYIDEEEQFLIGDDIYTPTVQNASRITNGTKTLTNEPVNLSVSAVDGQTAIDAVRINITYPDGTTTSNNLFMIRQGSSNNWTMLFNATSQEGTYNLIIYVNDTTDTINNTATGTFNVEENPSVTNVLPQSLSITFNQQVNISANVTDLSVLSPLSPPYDVFGNVTAPGGTQTRFQLLCQGGDCFLGGATRGNFSGLYNATTLEGIYNLTIEASDSRGNLNNTERGNFSLMQPPNVTNPNPPNGTNVLQGTILNISVNVSDMSNIDKVFANLTFPNGTKIKYPMINVSARNFSMLFNDTSQTGNYGVLYEANDAFGNLNNTISANFTVIDNSPPSVTNTLLTCQAPEAKDDIRECEPYKSGGQASFGDTFRRNTTFNASATITDNIAMDIAKLNMTFPNSTQKLLDLLNVSSLYSLLFNESQQKQLYTVRWQATDTSGNVNNTETGSFTIDNTVPSVTMITPAQTYVPNTIVNLSANVTDNFIREVNNSGGIVNCQGGGNTIDASSCIDSIIHFSELKDSKVIDNSFLNSTNLTNVFIRNATVINSTLFAMQVLTNATIENNQSIRGPTKDLMDIEAVLTELTFPNGTSKRFTYHFTLRNNYTIQFNDTSQFGTYTYTVLANDSSGNLNNTETGSFTISENNPPSVKFISPLPGSLFNQNNTINISANVTDDTAVDKVFANITFPNAFTLLMRLFNASEKNFTGLVNDTTQLGLYNITIIANDTLGNINDTEKTNFTIVREVDVFNASQLLINNSDRIFEFVIKNVNNRSNNLSWTFRTGEGEILGIQSVNLTSNETMFTYVRYSYSTNGTFRVIARANNSRVYDEENITVMV